jgi:hypothetical protein
MDRLARSGTVIDAFLLNFAKDEICGVGGLCLPWLVFAASCSTYCPLKTLYVESGFLNQDTQSSIYRF